MRSPRLSPISEESIVEDINRVIGEQDKYMMLQTRSEKRERLSQFLSTILKPVCRDLINVITSYAENSLIFEECSIATFFDEGLVAMKNPESSFRNTYDDWITVSVGNSFEVGRSEWEVLVEEHRAGEINGIVCGLYPENGMDIDQDMQCIGWSGPGWGAGNWGQRVVNNTQSGSFQRVHKDGRFGFVLDIDPETFIGRMAFFVNGTYQGMIFEDQECREPLRAGVCLFYPESRVRLIYADDVDQGLQNWTYKKSAVK